jgi:hypothetical protein
MGTFGLIVVGLLNRPDLTRSAGRRLVDSRAANCYDPASG